MLFQPIIYALIFVGVLLMVEGLYLIAFGKTLKREKKVNRRLTLLQEGRDTEEVLSILATSKAGGAFVPINALLFPAQVGHILGDCRPAALVTTRARLARVAGVTAPPSSPVLPRPRRCGSAESEKKGRWPAFDPRERRSGDPSVQRSRASGRRIVPT